MQASTYNGSASSAASNKRKRSPQGCVVAENDVIVEELQKIRGKVRESSHLAGNYGRAITSIQHHTEPITSARDAKQLRNIGNYIANQIQSILQKHQIRSAGEAPAPTAVSTDAARPAPERRPSPTATSRGTVQESRAPPSTVAATARRPYVPAQGKQPWYVLRALKDEDATTELSAVAPNVLLTKMQAAGYDGTLVKLRVCIAALLNTHQIITKASNGDPRSELAPTVEGLVIPSGARAAVAVTSESVQSSPRSLSAYPSNSPSVITNGQPRSNQAPEMVFIDLSDTESDNYDSDTATIRATSMSPRSQRDSEQVEPDAEPSDTIQPRQCESTSINDSSDELMRNGDEWEIVLILDHREILSRRNRDILERKLIEVNVTCEVRSLNVGDVQWVARRYRGCESVEEFMLNVIVERKEVRDLSGSIIDRRYNEQKTRLRDSGLTHVIYLVEGSLTQQTTVRSSGLQTALCRTQVQNQFFVQQCQNADESVAFLRGVHMNLLAKLPASVRCRNRERTSETSRLMSAKTQTMNDWRRQFCHPIRSYSDFNEQFRKKTDFTVGEIYQMMLMQVHSLSSSRTVALSEQYPTFQHLVKAIARGEKLQDVRYGESQRRLGAKTHEFVKFLFESTDYEINTPSVGAGTGGALDA